MQRWTRQRMLRLAASHIAWIRKHQTPGGGFLASTDYRPYQKVWLRDHALVGLALLRWQAGPAVQRAARFSVKILEQEAPRMARAAALPPGDPRALEEAFHPRARYRPDGTWIRQPWAERQYDGVALNLWFLMELEARTGRPWLSSEVLEIGLRYLARFWREPCAGPWEMYDQALHAWTLAAVHRALEAGTSRFSWVSPVVQELRAFFRKHLSPAGLPRKMWWQGRAVGWDAATLQVFLDFGGILEPAPARRLLALLDRWLSPDGLGLRRFVIPETGERDRYFGGGVWWITSVWAARLALKFGDPSRAWRLMERLPEGPLPEQWPGTAWEPAGRFYWHLKSRSENQGAPGPAQPLAWSHAAVLQLLGDLLEAGAL